MAIPTDLSKEFPIGLGNIEISSDAPYKAAAKMLVAALCCRSTGPPALLPAMTMPCLLYAGEADGVFAKAQKSATLLRVFSTKLCTVMSSIMRRRSGLMGFSLIGVLLS
jgi:hypothetical protein